MRVFTLRAEEDGVPEVEVELDIGDLDLITMGLEVLCENLQYNGLSDDEYAQMKSDIFNVLNKVNLV